MSKTFSLDTTAFRKEVLQADWMLQEVEKKADSQCGADQHVKSFIGFDRAKAIIYENTKEYPG